MPRLKVPEPPQHGSSTGSSQHRKKPQQRQKRPLPHWADRGSRSRSASTTQTGNKKRKLLSADEQACVALQYQQLPAGTQAKSKGLQRLCKQFNISSQQPYRITQRLKKKKKLASRKGAGGRPCRITRHVAEQLIAILKEHAYDLTFAQIQELTGIPAATVWRYIKSTKGWRITSKSCKPHLTDANLQARLTWARSNKRNKWLNHVDIDEKWFYIFSHGGKLKIPPGHEKPRTPVKSKRFIGKVMCLIAIGRPSPGNSGLIGCWRVTGLHTYQRRTTYRGTVYAAGDTRRVDANMDSAKWLQMMRDNVLPAIKSKAPNTTHIQWDNATPHTAENMREVESLLEQYGISRVVQCPNSPDTNALDLGFNKSLDSRLPHLRSFDLDEFEQQILEEFNAYPEQKLNDLFDMKQRICECIISCDPPGGNTFKLPHRKKK